MMEPYTGRGGREGRLAKPSPDKAARTRPRRAPGQAEPAAGPAVPGRQGAHRHGAAAHQAAGRLGLHPAPEGTSPFPPVVYCLS